ncbi:MAG: ABC transporter permease subunit [Acutalibacteraceae bacterium]
MTVFKHELRQGKISLCIWSVSIAFMICICVMIYPEMSTQMGDVGAMFADMGGFSQAFGMDKINFGEFIGFFGVECGNILGLGGAFFAALLGISALAKEEKEHTAEFLLTHPVSRGKVVAEKLFAVFAQITALNAICVAATALSIAIIGEKAPIKTVSLLFLAYYIMQLEIAGITFGISAFISRGGIGIGLGLATVFYFMNIISNLSEKADFLKYLTPFGYTEGSDIIAENAINIKYLAAGVALLAVGVTVGFIKYTKKDIK